MENLTESRPSIEETLLEIAFIMAKRGTCSRAQNGAIIASQNGVVLSSGWNGSLAGLEHCDHECNCGVDLYNSHVEDDNFKYNDHHDYCPAHPNNGCKIAVHAESNAVYFAARKGVSVEGQIIYCTMEPCIKCAEAIVQSGISKVVYHNEYRDHDGLDLLKQANIEVSMR